MPTERESDTDAYREHAHELIDGVIDSALQRLEDEYKREFGSRASSATSVASKKSFKQSDKGDVAGDAAPRQTAAFEYVAREKSNIAPDIEWMTGAEFTVEKADAKIQEFIKTTWAYQDNWLFCTDYTGVDEKEFDFRHRFRVRWSIPTRRAPIPRATASVYFTFVVSKIKPKNYPVDIYYVLEGNRLVHKPGDSVFRENWLKDTIESKVRMMEAVDF